MKETQDGMKYQKGRYGTTWHNTKTPKRISLVEEE